MKIPNQAPFIKERPAPSEADAYSSEFLAEVQAMRTAFRVIGSKLDAVEAELDGVEENLEALRDGVEHQRRLELEKALSDMAIQQEPLPDVEYTFEDEWFVRRYVLIGGGNPHAQIVGDNYFDCPEKARDYLLVVAANEVEKRKEHISNISIDYPLDGDGLCNITIDYRPCAHADHGSEVVFKVEHLFDYLFQH